jgi:cytochrome b-561
MQEAVDSRQPVSPTVATTPERDTVGTKVGSWFEERLGIKALNAKYGQKAFPVHSTFFFGEMAAFAFLILVLTGIYLGFMYVPSNAEVTLNGQTVPEAYASAQLIESVPVGNLFRNVHHWAAHLMVVSVLLHLLRVFFTGTYRKPRELNWIIGVVLLTLTLGAGFIGYSLPYDSYAVTATGVGYSIARSVPWIGGTVSELIFGGNFPTLGSIPRLYTIHVFILPALIVLTLSLHLLIIIKQKHTQPGYAKKYSEPGKVMGVPLWPYQALLAGQLLFLMFGALCILSIIVPAHPLDAFGPPGVGTPAVKPDWYLLWVYGLLEIIPPEVSFNFLGASIQPNFIGGVLFPGALFTLVAMVPFLDRTNRKVIKRFEYTEPPRQAPFRTALGAGVLGLLGALMIAAFYHDYEWSLGFVWALVVIIPLVCTGLVFLVSVKTYKDDKFDATGDDFPTPTVAEKLMVSLNDSASLIGKLDGEERQRAIAELDSLKSQLNAESTKTE